LNTNATVLPGQNVRLTLRDRRIIEEGVRIVQFREIAAYRTIFHASVRGQLAEVIGLDQRLDFPQQGERLIRFLLGRNGHLAPNQKSRREHGAQNDPGQQPLANGPSNTLFVHSLVIHTLRALSHQECKAF